MAIVPYKQWEEMKRWREEHRPRLPPNPNVVHTVNFQKDLSSVLADEDMSEAEKTQKCGETLHQFKQAHQKALQDARMISTVAKEATSRNIRDRIVENVPKSMRQEMDQLLSRLEKQSNLT